MIGAGYVWGRSLGAQTAAKSDHVINRLSRVLSAHSSENTFRLSDLEAGQGADIPPVEVFSSVLERVQREYVEDSSDNYKLSHGALTQMLASLDDPKTGFLEPPVRKVRQEAHAGKFRGIGAVLTVSRTKVNEITYNYVTVVGVMPGSPAEKAGIKTGDRITDIDAHWIRSYSIAVDIERLRKSDKSDAARQEEFKKIVERFQKGFSIPKAIESLISGEGKEMKLTLQRAGQTAPLKVTLKTALTEVDPVEFSIVGNKVGLLKIRQFNPRATQEFQQAFAALDPALKGLILDLRQNPGGVQSDAKSGVDGYQSALQLIGHLAGSGSIKIARRPQQPENIAIQGYASAPKLPLVVLVDQGTANLAELVASTLRDTRKAKIVGSKTFGDPVLQLFTILKDGSGIEMTTAHLLTAAGEDLSKGVLPDIAAGEDALQRALATLRA
jgi:carboxyl-terminal processing protease